MAVSDANIDDWTTAANTNLPTDATFIGRDLAVQFQTIKAVVREQSLEKEYEKLGKTTAGATSGTPSSISFFEADGNLVSTFPVNRKVRLRPSDGTTSYVYCGVLSSSFAANTTSVVLAELSGAITTGETYLVDVGTPAPGSDSLPLHVQAGTVTIANTDDDATATFTHRFPDEDYFACVRPVSNTAGLTPGARRVSLIDKGEGSMLIRLVAAPGNGNSVVLGWVAMKVL